jgi:pimeloyl-ACP methyl ester carboxylesterase
MATKPQDLAIAAVERAYEATVSLASGTTAYWTYPALSETGSNHSGVRASAQTILFVHGYRGNHHGLEAIAGALPDFNVIIPDLPGFGESDPLPVNHDIAGYTMWLQEFIDELKLHNAVVLGHSFGTIVAAASATESLTNPLILVNPISTFGFGGIKAVLAAIQNAFYWIGATLPERPGNALLKAPVMVRIMSEALAKTKDKNLRAWIHQQHHDNFSVYANRKVAVEGIKAGSDTSVVQFASRIEQRVLLIAGELDDITSVKDQKRAVELFANASLVVLPKVGHLTHYETPDAVAALVRESLKS